MLIDALPVLIVALLCIGIEFTSYMHRRYVRAWRRSRYITFHINTFNSPRTYY